MVKLIFQSHNNMDISIIAAIGKNNELGKNNDLIWKLKGDLKFFKDLTTNHIIVMGRKTFESLPKMLPNRHHIIISSNNSFNDKVEVFNNIYLFLEKYKNYKDEIFIIGGASIYKSFLEYANKLYLTEIDEEDKNADVYFPTFNVNSWNKEYISDLKEENNIKYRHVLYRRLK